MKTKFLLAAVSSFIIHHSAFGQGALTPPGAPAPTMKTLAQIEPRTPISSAPFTISQPGSYYLTTNLSVSSGNAITIANNGVTLDLGGFTIASTEPSSTGYAIQLNGGLRNLTIVNGFIQGGVTNNGSGTYGGPGFGYGIYSPGIDPVNTRVSGITVSGCRFHGIYVAQGNSTVVESCTVRTVGGRGIYGSTIKNSVAVDCGGDAIYGDQVADCRGVSTGSGTGIYASSTAQNCYGSSSSGNGINAATVQNCNGLSSGNGDGISATTALNCTGTSSGNGRGIYASSSAENCFGSSSSGNGISATTVQNSSGLSSGNGDGISTTTASNCTGTSSGGGRGIYASDLAFGCHGNSNSGPGLFTFIANACHGTSTSGTPLLTTHNVNSF